MRKLRSSQSGGRRRKDLRFSAEYSAWMDRRKRKVQRRSKLENVRRRGIGARRLEKGLKDENFGRTIIAMIINVEMGVRIPSDAGVDLEMKHLFFEGSI